MARITWCGGDHDGHREAAHTTASRRGSNGHGIGLLVSDAESVSSIQGADGPRLGSQNRTEASVPCHLIIASNGISPARDISRIAKAIPGCLVCPQIQCRGQFIRRYCRVRLHELLPERVWCRNSADVRHAALRSHERGCPPSRSRHSGVTAGHDSTACNPANGSSFGAQFWRAWQCSPTNGLAVRNKSAFLMPGRPIFQRARQDSNLRPPV